MSKKKIISIVGVRPQIIKASAISRAVDKIYSDKIEDIMIHTGQHYDKELSDVFFDELKMRKPKYNLKVGSAKYGRQTALMLAGIEETLLKEQPDCVMVYGDTNSTFAGALAASKLHFPVVHIEAGVRSFNKTTSEEINRVLTDHTSTLLFAPTHAAFKNLMTEGFRPENSPKYTIDNPKIFLTGDIMYDNALFFSERAEQMKNAIFMGLDVEMDRYLLVTVHREVNTDSAERLIAIFKTLLKIADDNNLDIVMPLHPKTINVLRNELPALYSDLQNNKHIRIKPPVSYLSMITLLKHARMVITDSVGLQKEAHFMMKPTLVLRKETEWVELVRNGTLKLVDADPDAIINGFNEFEKNRDTLSFPTFYGNGKAAEFILNEVMLMLE